MTDTRTDTLPTGGTGAEPKKPRRVEVSVGGGTGPDIAAARDPGDEKAGPKA